MIQTSVLQKITPKSVLRDSRGNLIKEGLRVAYNYQGRVIIGCIISYKSTWKVARPGIDDMKWWSCKFELKIYNEEGHISIVKNPNSFVII